MITTRVRIYPKLDKVAQVRQFMTEWVKVGQGQGEQLGLAQRIYSSEGPMLMIPRRFEDLAAADARRRENLADADWQGRLATLSTMIREPVRQSLEETIVPLANPNANVAIVRRVFFYPAVESAGQFRSRLTEFVQGVQAEGHGQVALAQQIFSETGPMLVITTTHGDMVELDQVRRERATQSQQLLESVASISRAPVAVRLLEVVVPFPG